MRKINNIYKKIRYIKSNNMHCTRKSFQFFVVDVIRVVSFEQLKSDDDD